MQLYYSNIWSATVVTNHGSMHASHTVLQLFIAISLLCTKVEYIHALLQDKQTLIIAIRTSFLFPAAYFS